jgi:hypothetical protein
LVYCLLVLIQYQMKRLAMQIPSERPAINAIPENVLFDKMLDKWPGIPSHQLLV